MRRAVLQIEHGEAGLMESRIRRYPDIGGALPIACERGERRRAFIPLVLCELPSVHSTPYLKFSPERHRSVGVCIIILCAVAN